MFDFSLDEVAEALASTPGAIKAALHRGRGRLSEPESQSTRVPQPGALDAFCEAFNARDLNRLTALLLDSAAVEVVGVTTQYGKKAARETVLPGMLYGSTILAEADKRGGIEPRFMQGVLAVPPRCEVRLHRDAWVLLLWYAHADGEAVRAINRLEFDGEGVSRLQNYFYNPDLLVEVCQSSMCRIAVTDIDAAFRAAELPTKRKAFHVAEFYFHPLASYCWKVLIALYENETPFQPRLVDLGNAAEREALERLWPITKFPLLRDLARDQTVPESSIIIEYLARHHPRQINCSRSTRSRTEVRLWDRFFDTYVHEPMQRIVGDKLRPAGSNDAHGVGDAKRLLLTAYGMIEERMSARTWVAGDTFTMADCAAAPALHYANRVLPFGDAHKNTAGYLSRLERRPSFARVIAEAQPYFHLFPG